MKDRYASQALFRATGKDGADWLFVVRGDGGWAILQNGKEFDSGTGETASVISGVKNFFSLTHVIAECDAALDPVLTGLIDRIERGRPSTGKVAKLAGKVKPHRLQRSSAFTGR